ncbi:MAG: stalk domain-containing protein [Firmicutes bacterium]|nr:stalk domain-containing protein [Bacillota bacterium]
MRRGEGVTVVRWMELRKNRTVRALVLTLALVICGAGPSRETARASPAWEFYHVVVDGKPLAPGALAARSWLDVMLPAGAVFEAMGWQVTSAAATGPLEAARGADRVVVRAGSSRAEVSGKPLVLKHACFGRGGDIMTPAEVFRFFGAEVAYDARVGLVKVVSPETSSILGRRNLGPSGAAVACIAASAGGERIYAATIHHGLYASSDGGITWEHLGLEGGGIPRILEVSPRDPRVVFYSKGSGLDRSSDGGRTWTAVRGLPDPFAMTFDPSGKVAYAACAEGSMVGGSTVTLYRSTDGGLSWAATGSSVSSYLMGDILVHPGTGSLLLGSGCAGEEGGRGAVKTSRDGGRTWKQSAVEGVLGLSVTPDGVVYSAGLQGLWSSTDGGMTWTRLDPGIALSPYLPAVVTGDSVLVVAEGGGEAAVSRDAGTSWKRLAGPPGRPTAVCSDGSSVYLACGDRLWKSPDSGDTWISIDEGLTCTSICAATAEPGGMPRYASSPSREFWRRGDDGRWERLSPVGFPEDDGWEVVRLVQDPRNAESVFAVVVRGGLTPWVRAGELYHSADAGANWERVDAFPDGGVSAVAFDPVEPGAVWVALADPCTVGGVHVSRDGGKTFAPDGLLGIGVTDMAVGPTGSVWAGTAGGVWVKAAADSVWTERTHGLSGLQVRRIAADPFDAARAYVVSDGGLSVTADWGATWRRGDPGYPWAKGVPWYEDLCEIVAHPGREGLVILRGRQSGLVWYTLDRGVSWSEVPGLDPGLEVVGLNPGPGTGLALHTNGAGILYLERLPDNVPSPTPGAQGWTTGTVEWPAAEVDWVKGTLIPERTAWRVMRSGAHAFMQAQGGILASDDGLLWTSSVPATGGTGGGLETVAPLAGGVPGVAYATAAEYSEYGLGETMFRTTDGGTTWEPMGRTPGELSDIPYCAGSMKGRCTAASAVDAGRLVMAGWTMNSAASFFSNDGGRTWSRCRGLPDDRAVGVEIVAGPGGKAEFVAFSPTRDRLYRSGDGGRTFTPLATVPRGTGGLRPLLAGADRLYIGRDSMSYDGRPLSRVGCPGGIEDWRFQLIAASRESPGRLLGGYRLTDGRFFRIHMSTDYGKTWRLVTGQIGNPAALACAFLSGDSVLLVTTHGAGGGVQTWVGTVKPE